MRRAKLLSLLLLTFATCNSGCSTADKLEDKYVDQGPVVTSCVVDLASGGYQCATYDKDPFFLPFKDARAMECIAPMDLETSLKACKKGKKIEVQVCTISEQDVSCQSPVATATTKTLSSMDNYFCLTPTDRARLLQRCTPNGY